MGLFQNAFYDCFTDSFPCWCYYNRILHTFSMDTFYQQRSWSWPSLPVTPWRNDLAYTISQMQQSEFPCIPGSDTNRSGHFSQSTVQIQRRKFQSRSKSQYSFVNNHHQHTNKLWRLWMWIHQFCSQWCTLWQMQIHLVWMCRMHTWFKRTLLTSLFRERFCMTMSLALEPEMNTSSSCWIVVTSGWFSPFSSLAAWSLAWISARDFRLLSPFIAATELGMAAVPGAKDCDAGNWMFILLGATGKVGGKSRRRRRGRCEM